MYGPSQYCPQNNWFTFSMFPLAAPKALLILCVKPSDTYHSTNFSKSLFNFETYKILSGLQLCYTIVTSLMSDALAY